MKPTPPLGMRLRGNAAIASSGGVAYLFLVRWDSQYLTRILRIFLSTLQ
jgi:hypothetical protein